MTQNEMIRNLTEKCNVTTEEALAALEAGEWNMLTAAQLLENEKVRRAQEIENVVSSCAAATAQAVADEAAGNAQGATTESVQSTEKSARARDVKHRGGKGLKNLGEHIRRLVVCGNRNRFAVRRNGATLLEMPVTVAALLMLFAFWTCVPLLVIGLFLGCRYSFSGQDFDKAIEYMKNTAAEA